MKRSTVFFFLMAPVFVIAALAAVPAGIAEAQPGFSGPIVPQECNVAGNCGFCDLLQLADNIMRFLVFAATIIAVLMFVYGGFIYITAGFSTRNIQKAHRIFGFAVLGFVLVLAAWLIVATVARIFIEGSALPWDTFECVN